MFHLPVTKCQVRSMWGIKRKRSSKRWKQGGWPERERLDGGRADEDFWRWRNVDGLARAMVVVMMAVGCRSDVGRFD